MGKMVVYFTYSYGPKISLGNPGARIHESQPVLPLCVGGGFCSYITRIKLTLSPSAPSHWRRERLSPNKMWLNKIAIKSSANPNNAVCIPPIFFTPRNSAIREKTVTKVKPATGSQGVYVVGHALSKMKYAGMTIALIDSNV